MDDRIIEFLQQSNYIENEPSGQALDDAVEAWRYIISKPTLNKGRILHVHSMLMQTRPNIPLSLIGHFRKPVGNLTGNVQVGGHTKLDWKLVPKQIEQWIINANDLVLNGQKEDREFLKDMIIRQHVKFENIHPFIDGNGRIGRILMNWSMVKLGFEVKVIMEEDKFEYYQWFKEAKWQE